MGASEKTFPLMSSVVAKWTSSLSPFFVTNEENTLILLFLAQHQERLHHLKNPRQKVKRAIVCSLSTSFSQVKWFMKNLSNSLSDIFAEKSVNFYGKMNFSFAKLPSFVISLRFGAFSWDQLPLKKPWICLIFEMLKSLHENWNCTAPPDKSKGCWNNTFWWLWCVK